MHFTNLSTMEPVSNSAPQKKSINALTAFNAGINLQLSTCLRMRIHLQKVGHFLNENETIMTMNGNPSLST